MQKKLSILFIAFFIVIKVFTLSFFKRKKTMSFSVDPDRAEYYYKKANTGLRPWIKKKKYKVEQWFKKKKNIRENNQVAKEWAKVEK